MPVETVARPLSKRCDCDIMIPTNLQQPLDNNDDAALLNDLQQHLGNKEDEGVVLFNDHVDIYGFFDGDDAAGGLWDGMRTPEGNKIINSSPVAWFFCLSKCFL